MKWFEKHTNDRNDRASKQIKRKFGIAGYGIYESLQQIVGENMEGENYSEWGFVGKEWTMEKLAEEIGCSIDEFRAFVTFCDDQLILERRSGRLFLPLLLERMNEYAKRLYNKSLKDKTPVTTEYRDNRDISASQHNTITTQPQSQHKELNNSEMPSAEVSLGVFNLQPTKGSTVSHEFQAEALRMGESLGITKPSGSWFKLFKDNYSIHKGLIDSTYASMADIEGISEPEKYFFKVFNAKKRGEG